MGEKSSRNLPLGLAFNGYLPLSHCTYLPSGCAGPGSEPISHGPLGEGCDPWAHCPHKAIAASCSVGGAWGAPASRNWPKQVCRRRQRDWNPPQCGESGAESPRTETMYSHSSRHPFHPAYWRWDPCHETVKSFTSSFTKHPRCDQIHRQTLSIVFYHSKSKCRELFLFSEHWENIINDYKESFMFWETFSDPWGHLLTVPQGEVRMGEEASHQCC